jgi:hypothetical protein
MDSTNLAILEHAVTTGNLSNCGEIQAIMTPVWEDIKVNDLIDLLHGMNPSNNVPLEANLLH